MNILYGKEDTAYYTPDLDDAIYTAFAEWGRNITFSGSAKVQKEAERIMKELKEHESKGNQS